MVFSESRFPRPDDRHRPVCYLQFRQDARDIILHGFDTQAEVTGNKIVVVPLRNQI